jgi:spermidine synthase
MKATRNDKRAAANTPMTSVAVRERYPVLQVCFFLSGAAGLIYQVAWMKALGLLFGYTAYATATAIAVFMGGLALGSFFLGRWCESRPDAVRIYAWLEFGIGCAGALSLIGLLLVRTVYLAAHASLAGSPVVLICFRVVGAALVLGIPSFLMGGTFPVLIRGVIRQQNQLAVRIGRLYAVNTLGAVVGTLGAGFIFLPAMGLRLTVFVAAALNFGAGWIALQTASRAGMSGSLEQTPAAKQTTKNAAPGLGQRQTQFVLAAFALVGFTAIAYEIAWTRMLATFLGSSTYAFTVMLSTFLLGIVIGSFLFERFFSGVNAICIAGFCWTQTAISTAVLFFLFYFSGIPELIPAILRATGNSFSGTVLTEFFVCSLAMLPTAIVFGINFPLVVAVLTGGNSTDSGSATVGKAYAANTAGGIVGALAGGFVLLPLLGSFRLLVILAACNAVLAISLWFLQSQKSWPAIAANLAAVGLSAYLGISGALFSRTIAGFGALLYGNYHDRRLTVREIADTEDVVFFQDGVNATISVTRSDDYVALRTNGKVDASNLDTSTQLLLGDLGAVFHPHPRRVLIVGLGGGMTGSAAARFPDVEQIDCVEIEPAVLRAQPLLTRLNRGVLADPRFHLIFDDARSYLQTTRNRYDLIISEPSNPWIAGIATLYTKEFYAALRQRLEPNGVFVQWVQAYGLAPDDFRMIVASLAPSFEDLSLWRSSNRDYLLLGRTQSGDFSFERARKMWGVAELQQDFQTLKLAAPESWLAYFRLSDKELRKLAVGAELNTDDRTRLEFEAPKRLLTESLTEELARYLTRYSRDVLPGNLQPEDVPLVRLAAAETALDLNDARAAQWLEKGLVAPPEKLLYLRGRLALQQRRAQEAVGLLKSSLKENTNQLSVLYWLAAAEAQSNDPEAATGHLQQILALRPRDQRVLTALVRISENKKDWDGAIAWQTLLRDAEDGTNAVSYCRLGDFYLRKSDLASAEKPLREGLQRDGNAYLCHRDLGELLRARGQLQEAEAELQFVVKHFPEADPKTYASLALLYKAQSKQEAQHDVLVKGRRIFPEDSLLARLQVN